MKTPSDPKTILSDLSEAQVIEKLKVEVEKSGSNYSFAKQHNISPSYISAVLRGKALIGNKILKVLKLKKTIKFEADL